MDSIMNKKPLDLYSLSFFPLNIDSDLQILFQNALINTKE